MFWIARDKDGSLFSYNNKPWRQTVDGMWIDNDDMGYVDWKDETMYLTQLPTCEFPELTWEDEPLEVSSIPKTIDEEKLDELDYKHIGQNTSIDTENEKVTTVDRAIEIEALKAYFCGFIPKGDTDGETDYNIFSYAYKLGMKHNQNYPDAKE